MYSSKKKYLKGETCILSKGKPLNSDKKKLTCQSVKNLFEGESNNGKQIGLDSPDNEFGSISDFGF